jgi:voltage-gated potassium channel
MAVASLRLRLHRALDPAARPRGLSKLNIFIALAIIASVAVAVLETEASVAAGREALFRNLEILFAGVFAVEYALRFWTAAEDARLGSGWRARWRWMVSPAAIIDVLAIVPALALSGLAPSYMLRLLRLARILRLAKLGRLSRAWRLMSEAIRSRRYELLLTLFAAVFVMLVSATLLYLVEGPAQPEKFGSIPRALWWSVVTLTTIGYGDVYPESPLGRVLAAFTAVMGVGLIAAPAGILAGAFTEALQRHREREEASKGP